jgi:2-amino-4-hydroxy-6-hydroxymethyldihydropteridine diphosphokinase
MAACLIALGSNLGDRAALMRRAVEELARLARTRLVARSAWRETPPVGGPPGQGPFLNGAALVATALEPAELLAELLRIEARLGRVRSAPWGERAIDLDVLLYGETMSPRDLPRGPAGLLGRPQSDVQVAPLEIPHPRMHYRYFVLAGAAEIAAWMVHPPSGWTVARLLAQLDNGANEAAVVAADAGLADSLVARLNERLAAVPNAPRVVRFDGGAWNPGPKVLLAAGATTGRPDDSRRKMMQLPTTGPLVWLESEPGEDLVAEAWSVLASAWPALAVA